MNSARLSASVVTISVLFATASGFLPHLPFSDEWKVASRCLSGSLFVAFYLWFVSRRRKLEIGFRRPLFWLAAFLQLVTVAPFSYSLIVSGAAVTQIVFYSIFPLFLIVATALRERSWPTLFDCVEFALNLAALLYLFSDDAAWRSTTGILCSTISAFACAWLIILQTRMSEGMRNGAIAVGLAPGGLIALGSPLPSISLGSFTIATAMGLVSQSIPSIWHGWIVKKSGKLGRIGVLMMLEPVFAVFFEWWPGLRQPTPHEWKAAVVATIVFVVFQLIRLQREEK